MGKKRGTRRKAPSGACAAAEKGPGASKPRAPQGRRSNGTFEALTKTVVYQTLPLDVRARLDAAILLRPSDCPNVDAAYHKLRLKEEHGLKPADLREYAEALESFSRPLMSGLAVSALLKALPPRVLSGLGQANRLVVWSRLVQALTDPEADPLKAGEFAKLAELLRPRSRPWRAAGGQGPVRLGMSRYWRGPQRDLSAEILEPAIKEVYGLSLTGEKASAGAGAAKAGRAGLNDDTDGGAGG